MEKRLDVCIIDDAKDSLRIMSKFLERENFSLHLYDNAKNALDDLNVGKSFDILITDYHLGSKINGTTAAAFFKKHLSQITTILMSGDDCVEWKAAGFDGFLLKPISFKSLGEQVRTIHQKSLN